MVVRSTRSSPIDLGFPTEAAEMLDCCQAQVVAALDYGFDLPSPYFLAVMTTHRLPPGSPSRRSLPRKTPPETPRTIDDEPSGPLPEDPISSRVSNQK